MKRALYISAALCGLSLVHSASAADAVGRDPSSSSNSTSTNRMAGNLSHGDRSFVEKAAKSGMEEVAISRIAAERATNPQVREFAQMMVTDHSANNTELTSLAATKGVTLPAKEMDVNKWEKRSAKSFDEEYMEKMVSDHKDDVELFEKQAKKGEDAELMSFASRTLPTLQSHLQRAQEIKKMVK